MGIDATTLQMTFSHWPALEYIRMDTLARRFNPQFIFFEAANILGYSSKIGKIIGAARIIFAATQLNQDEDAKAKYPFIARGLLEFSSLGICLIPIDLINTYLLQTKLSRVYYELSEIVVG